MTTMSTRRWHDRQEFCFRMLESAEDVDLAREMLFKRLVGPGWPPRRDRGGVTVAMSQNGRPMLVDSVDDRSRFAALVSCASAHAPCRICAVWRLTPITPTQPPPIAMYRPWTPEVPDFLLERPSAEGTRLALEPELRGASGLMSLMDGAFRWMEQAGIETLVTSAQVPQPAGHFLQLGLKRAPVEAFVFGPTDRRPSFLLYITVAEARRIIDGYLGAHDAAA